MAWLAEQGRAFRDTIEFGTLDLSGPYGRVFEIMVSDATMVADRLAARGGPGWTSTTPTAKPG